MHIVARSIVLTVLAVLAILAVIYTVLIFLTMFK